LYHLRVRGTAIEGEQTYTATATLPKPDPNKAGKEPVMAALLSMPRPPRLLSQSFPVCVGPEAPDFFRIELTTPAVLLPTIVGKSAFVLRQTALNDAFDDNSRLTFNGLPEGVSIRNENGRGGRIKGQIDFICEVSGPPTLHPGTHSFEVIAQGEFKGVQKEVKLAKVPLRVVLPLQISATLEGPLSPGKNQRLKIVATRFEETDPQPIQVRLTHFPAGLSGNNSVTIPAAESAAVLELSPGKEALVGKSNSLTLSATTRVLGQEVTVDSTPIELEVQP
jgi:hypothetical protein